MSNINQERDSNSSILSYFNPQTERKKRDRNPGSPEALVLPPKRVAMDQNKKVGDLNLGQLLEAMKGLLVDVATKEDINKISEKISSLEEENAKLKEDVENLQKRDKDKDRKIAQIENQLRRKNLVFKGLQWREGDDQEEIIKDFCSKSLQITDINVDNIKAIGRATSNRPLLVTFPNEKVVSNVLKSARKLSGTKYGIDRDFTAEIRKKRSFLRFIKKELNQIDQKKNVCIKSFITFSSIVINSYKFDLNDALDLEIVDGNGLHQLSQIIKEDATDWFFQLKNEWMKRSEDQGRNMKNTE